MPEYILQVKFDGKDLSNQSPKLESDLKKVSKAGDDVTKSTEKLSKQSKKTSGAVKELGDEAKNTAKNLVGAGALVAALGASFKAASDLEFKMAEVSTLLGDTSGIDALTQSARELATTFGTSPISQVEALYQAISAGATTSASAIQTLEQANKLAIGGITDVTTAVDILTTVTNAYGDEAESASEISDTLFIGMKAGKTTIGELSSSLGAAIPFAATLGVDLEELVSATAALTKGGLTTSVAVNSLRAVLSGVIKVTPQAAKEAKRLRLEFSETALKTKGLSEFLKDIQEKTGGSSESLAKLFGSVEGLGAVLGLVGKQSEDFNEILESMESKVGETDIAFGKMTDTFNFQWKVLTANIADLGITFGDILLPALKFVNRELIEGIESWKVLFGIGRKNEIPEELDEIAEKSKSVNIEVTRLVDILDKGLQGGQADSARQRLEELREESVILQQKTKSLKEEQQQLLGTLGKVANGITTIGNSVGETAVETDAFQRLNDKLGTSLDITAGKADKFNDTIKEYLQFGRNGTGQNFLLQGINDFAEGLEEAAKQAEQLKEKQEQLKESADDYNKSVAETISVLEAQAEGDKELAREIEKVIIVNEELARLGGENSEITREQIESDFDRIDSLEKLIEKQENFNDSISEVVDLFFDAGTAGGNFFDNILDSIKQMAIELAKSGIIELITSLASGQSFNWQNVFSGANNPFIDAYQNRTGGNGSTVITNGSNAFGNAASVYGGYQTAQNSDDTTTQVIGYGTAARGAYNLYQQGRTLYQGANTASNISVAAQQYGQSSNAVNAANTVQTANTANNASNAANASSLTGAGVAAFLYVVDAYAKNNRAKKQAHTNDIFENQVTDSFSLNNGIQIRSGIDQSNDEQFDFIRGASNLQNVIDASGGGGLSRASRYGDFIQVRDNIEEVRETLSQYSVEVQEFQALENIALRQSIEGIQNKDDRLGTLAQNARFQAEDFVKSIELGTVKNQESTKLIVAAYGTVETKASEVSEAIKDGLISAAEASALGLEAGAIGMVSNLGAISDESLRVAATVISEFGTVESSLTGVAVAIEDGFINASEAALNGLNSLAIGGVKNFNAIGEAAVNAQNSISVVESGRAGNNIFNPAAIPATGSSGGGRARGGTIFRRGTFELGEDGAETIIPSNVRNFLMSESFTRENKKDKSQSIDSSKQASMQNAARLKSESKEKRIMQNVISEVVLMKSELSDINSTLKQIARNAI